MRHMLNEPTIATKLDEMEHTPPKKNNHLYHTFSGGQSLKMLKPATTNAIANQNNTQKNE